jgi:hypothetical protein
MEAVKFGDVRACLSRLNYGAEFALVLVLKNMSSLFSSHLILFILTLLCEKNVI